MMPCCVDPCKANEVHSGSMGIRMRLGLDSSSVTAIEVVVLRPNRCQEMIRPYSHPDCASQDYMPQCHQPLLTSLPPTTTTTFHFRFESFTPATDIPHITPKGSPRPLLNHPIPPKWATYARTPCRVSKSTSTRVRRLSTLPMSRY